MKLPTRINIFFLKQSLMLTSFPTICFLSGFIDAANNAGERIYVLSVLSSLGHLVTMYGMLVKIGGSSAKRMV